MDEILPERLRRVLAGTPELSRAFLVGGCVRDWLLGRAVKDFDVECFGISYEALVASLAKWGRTDLVGRSFGVVKLTVAPGETYDFSVARRDSKTGAGHKGFAVTIDPDLSPEIAAGRRDYTVNALMWDPRDKHLLDFFDGERDLRDGVLRHAGPAFSEDPLRVLRGMQFAARFDLTGAPETLALCRDISDSYPELAVERVREEWFKWAGRSVRPSAGLRFLRDSGWLRHFPEIAALDGVPQDPQWHPEGDVFVHTGHCCDAMAGLEEWRAAPEATRIVLMLAILTHDFGKPATTREEVREGRTRIVSPGHEDAGVPIAEAFLARIDVPPAIRERVCPLVQNHMVHTQPLSDRGLRRLARRLQPENIEHLGTVITADAMGRPPAPANAPATVALLRERAAMLDVKDDGPRPILLGRHLLERGWRPGPAMGRCLKTAFEAQLDGEYSDLPGAVAWLDKRGRE